MNKQAFVTFWPENGHTRVFIFNKKVEASWVSREEAEAKAKELDCDFFIDGEDDYRDRVAEYNKVTEPFLMRTQIYSDWKTWGTYLEIK